MEKYEEIIEDEEPLETDEKTDKRKPKIKKYKNNKDVIEFKFNIKETY